MAVPTERAENVAFPRPLPHPVFFAWATWVTVCALAYWIYYQAAGARISVLLSAGFWVFALVLIPAIVQRSRERLASLVAATLALLAYALLMQDVLH
jgi:uncharacterized membrane protein